MTTPGRPARPTGADLGLDPEQPVSGTAGGRRPEQPEPGSSGQHHSPAGSGTADPQESGWQSEGTQASSWPSPAAADYGTGGSWDTGDYRESYGAGESHAAGDYRESRGTGDYGTGDYGAGDYRASHYGRADSYRADDYHGTGGRYGTGDDYATGADYRPGGYSRPGDSFRADGYATESFGEPIGAAAAPLGADDTEADLTAEAAAIAAERREPGDASASLVRSSGVMAIGSLASRFTGFVRTVVQAYALGTVALADAYNNANTLPNVVYNLMLGGILTSVIVPLLVNAAKRNRGRSDAYDQRMFTLVTIALAALTLVATLAAAPIVYLYKGTISGPELHLMVIFAYFFIPQVFFYGVSSMAGAILNSRGHFAAPMWTPVVNNVVVIAVLLMFMDVAAPSISTASGGPIPITGGEVGLLGLGTTLGIVAQTAALIPALRRAGFRWRPRFDFRRAEVAEIQRMAGWMFGYVATTQVAFLITTRVANDASQLARHAHVAYGAGYTPYTYAWQLFQLPYAIVGISVITALLPRMSAHAAERRFSLVTADFSTGVRLSSVIVVPAALVLAVLGPSLAEGLLSYGSTSTADARYIGEVFAVFCLGLVPYMLFQLQLRVFYSLHDSRTPALIGGVTMVVNIVTNLIALHVLPPGQVVAGLGVGFGLANLTGTVLAWYILSRRLRGLDGRKIGAALLRMHAAAIPPALFAIAVILMVGVVLPAGRLNAIVTAAVACCGGLLLYVLFAKAFGVAEVEDLTSSIRARLGR